MMTGYTMEVFAEARSKDLLDEAENRRLLREAATPNHDKGWRATLARVLPSVNATLKGIGGLGWTR